MIHGTWLRQGSSQPEFPLVDLVDYVVHRMSQSTQSAPPTEPQRILILSSKATYDADLYPKYLETAGWKSGAEEAMDIDESQSDSAAGTYFKVSSPTQATKLQDAIDLAKKGKTKESRVAMRAVILSETQRMTGSTTPIQILLGCTEIPLALSGRAGTALAQAVRKQTGAPVTLVDSNQLFAEKIADDLIFLSQLSSH